MEVPSHVLVELGLLHAGLEEVLHDWFQGGVGSVSILPCILQQTDWFDYLEQDTDSGDPDTV